MQIVIGQTGNFSVWKATWKGVGSVTSWRGLEGMLVPLYKIVTMTRFMQAKIKCFDLQSMRANYLINGLKPQGMIIKRSQQKARLQQPRTLSLQRPMPDYATITSNDSIKIPGQIKRLNPRCKVDRQVYYNADFYKTQPKLQQTMSYEESQTVLPVKRDLKEVNISPVTNNSKVIQHLQSIKQEAQPIQLDNIHGRFDIQKYNESYRLLSNILSSFSLSQFELSAALAVYAEKAMLANSSEVNDVKLAYSKKEVLKQSFIKEREAVILVCLTMIVGKLQKMRNYCSNLLRLVFENYLVSLNILAENSGYVYELMKQSGKEYLQGKGFEVLRSNNQVINDLMVKIIQVDPLFGQEYYKIKESHPATTVAPFLLAMLSFFAFYINACKAESIVPFLAVAPEPYISEASSQEYTLVIDFMRVFLDQSSRRKKQRLKNQAISVRPYSSYFLKQMSKYYEIVSFCESMPIECNKQINTIDEDRIIKHRLFKFHIDSNKRKDVSKLGRSLDKIILLDTFTLQENENLLLVNGWKGQNSDAQLAELSPLLAQIAFKKLPTRSSLRKIREAVNWNSSLGLKYINCGLSL